MTHKQNVGIFEVFSKSVNLVFLKLYLMKGINKWGKVLFRFINISRLAGGKNEKARQRALHEKLR